MNKSEDYLDSLLNNVTPERKGGSKRRRRKRKADFEEDFENELSGAGMDDFMQAMNEIGVAGITVTNVMGCGVQKGTRTYYRGVSMEMSLLPKIKIEIVVSLIPVQKVIDTAKSVLHTGQMGDGKLFLYDIENVVKIRTGEEGFLALQDTQD